MRKISKTRASLQAADADLLDSRPRGIAGATITSWPGTLDIDLEVLFAQGVAGATVTGAAPNTAPARAAAAERTLSLSDGTRITFSTAGQFEVVESV